MHVGLKCLHSEASSTQSSVSVRHWELCYRITERRRSEVTELPDKQLPCTTTNPTFSTPRWPDAEPSAADLQHQWSNAYLQGHWDLSWEVTPGEETARHCSDTTTEMALLPECSLAKLWTMSNTELHRGDPSTYLIGTRPRISGLFSSELNYWLQEITKKDFPKPRCYTKQFLRNHI